MPADAFFSRVLPARFSNVFTLSNSGSEQIYNKVARTLVAFEYLWYQAWVQSIEQAKAGLQVSAITSVPFAEKGFGFTRRQEENRRGRCQTLLRSPLTIAYVSWLSLRFVTPLVGLLN